MSERKSGWYWVRNVWKGKPSNWQAAFFVMGEWMLKVAWDEIGPRIPQPDEPTDPGPSATGLCGNAEDYEEYTSALRAAFGEGMGDGAETSLTCEIERLSRLAEQAVAMRQHFGKAVWCLDGEGISEFLKAATGAPSATCQEEPSILFKAAQFLNEAAWVERFKQSYAATGAPSATPLEVACGLCSVCEEDDLRVFLFPCGHWACGGCYTDLACDNCVPADRKRATGAPEDAPADWEKRYHELVDAMCSKSWMGRERHESVVGLAKRLHDSQRTIRPLDTGDAGYCSRLQGHDGPCNGYPRPYCLERFNTHEDK